MKNGIAVLIVLLVAINNNLNEYLTGAGYDATVIMLYNGSIAFAFTFILAKTQQASLKVANYRLLILRVIIDAVSIWCLLQSFKYLSASSVAIVQRMDIPFLILIAYLRGRVLNSLQFYFSIWTVIILFFFAFDAKFNNEDPIGFVYALAGVILFSLTLLIIRSQTTRESVHMLSMSYSFSGILGGLVFGLLAEQSFQVPVQDLPYFAATGAIQVFIVLLGVQLLKVYQAEMARLPYVLGAFATMLLEMVVEQKIFNFNQIGLSAIIIGLLITLCLNPSAPKPVSLRKGK